ncbi:glucan endo-1 3-alpha-glucosidase agn1 [Fusarium mundagurra]|uniref:Glucan endo-1 3-alpha-glucosidase agn1 n=1 Tax=Fusarium mundagurra TaxID=1567541 RepID=A0A8H5YY47_9HYPO|nr:glucan endo-1 3-alpha-glucosidase agn1 [Fusarium mundagurra]
MSATQASDAPSKNTQNPDDWRSQQCTDEVIIDAAIDPQKRWDGVNCDDAWKDALVRWENPTIEGQLSFPEAVSNFFHGPENLRCDITTDHNGCDAFRQCHDTNHPAGYLILNSMVALNNIIMNFYDGIVRAQSLISDSMNEITKTFAPKPKDETQALKIVLDVLGLSYALFAAPFWNMAMKRLPYFGDRGDQHGASKDTINGAISNTITIIKDKLPSPGDMNNDLTKGLAQMAALWYDSTSEMKKQLFNGSEPSVASLTSLIEDGKLLANAYEPVDDPTIQAMISKALYSILIPLAWSLAPNFSPVVMDAHAQCDMIDPLVPDEISLVTSQRTWTCHDGWLYYLVTTEGSAQKCFGSPMSRQGERCEDLPFSAAPGIETLDDKRFINSYQVDVFKYFPAMLFLGNVTGTNSVAFDLKNTPSLQGKTNLIPGGNSGIGKQAICYLALLSPSEIWLAVKYVDNANVAVTDIKRQAPNVRLQTVQLNLALFLSIKAAVETLVAQIKRLDILFLNVGVMGVPAGLTEDGYEYQFGINHLGHAV